MPLLLTDATCADPESFARGGPTLTTFVFDEGKENPKSTSKKRAIIGSQAERWIGSFVIFRGSRQVLVRNSIRNTVFL